MTRAGLRFGYFIGQDVPHGGTPAQTVREVLAEARAAERAGFDGVFVGEHHGAATGYLNGTAAGFLPASIPLMYLIVASTERVQVGSAVVLLTLTQPSRVAEEIALLDHVSGGRLVFGVGAGYVADDFATFGVDPENKAARLEEAIAVLRRLWSEQRVDHDGPFYPLSGVGIFPPPLTPGGPPLWVGGRSPAGIRLAARVGDGWLLDATPSRDLFAGWHRLYREQISASGRQPHTAVLRDAWVDVGAAIDARYRDAVLATARAKVAAGVYAVDPDLHGRNPAVLTFDDFARRRWLTGDAKAVQAELDAWQEELGVEYVLIRMRTRGLPGHRDTLEQIEAFGELVIGAPARRAGTAT